ncbi:hypothetical protein BN1051_03297 [Arthrobacter saudimassiliensis]|uniref:Gram-positive cocci surface proteins LPxTG domain-containing protein n=1 Tax=Arthrobacter saudimassiliensis TaxID=1461584 RepID=A0A078MWS0_9MICC|nr:hypothetical protein BN1051_03297 [Arthrobacter saudimassiliensis]
MVLLPFAAPAQARVGDIVGVVSPIFGPNTDMQMNGTGAGQNVLGAVPPAATPQDPTAPYPASPPAGYTAENGFAGIITTASIDDPTLTGEMYCINIRVLTEPGIGYENGTWAESNVSNVGYVAYILNNYYPANPAAPAGLTANQQAAAVQAAIWYFSDGCVLNADQTAIRPAVEAIIADAQANGPVVEPPAPNVTVTPPSAAAPVGSPAGPFTVAAENAAVVTVSVPEGFTMYSDAAGTVEIANESEVASGTQIWIRSAAVIPDSGVLSARAAVTVQRGEVYLYDGNNPAITDAQRLILAQTAVLEATAQATAEFFPVGDLSVTKSFLGEAAGQQGAGQLLIDCGEGYTFNADVPAGAVEPATFVFTDIPVGTTCVVTEPITGATTAVDVTTDTPQEAVLTAEGAAVAVTNTVSYRPGSLNVTKVITGTGAGLQGEISVNVVCADVLNETILLPAGTAAGEYVQAFADLPAGTECTVTETATGAVQGVQVKGGDPVTVAIQPGAAIDAVLTNEVSREPAPAPAPERPSLPETGAGGTLPLLGAGAAAPAAGALLLIPGLIRSRRTQG